MEYGALRQSHQTCMIQGAVKRIFKSGVADILQVGIVYKIFVVTVLYERVIVHVLINVVVIECIQI